MFIVGEPDIRQGGCLYCSFWLRIEPQTCQHQVGHLTPVPLLPWNIHHSGDFLSPWSCELSGAELGLRILVNSNMGLGMKLLVEGSKSQEWLPTQARTVELSSKIVTSNNTLFFRAWLWWLKSRVIHQIYFAWTLQRILKHYQHYGMLYPMFLSLRLWRGICHRMLRRFYDVPGNVHNYCIVGGLI